MMRRTAVLILGASMLAGCRREPKAAAPLPVPTTRVVATTRPTAPPATKPAEPTPVTLVINGQAFDFPPAKLVVQSRDDHVRVSLFSDDPPEAVKDGYTGNSFYFAFDLDGDAAEGLDGQGFAFHNSNAGEHEDTSNGVYIAGGRQTLRPIEATIGFAVEDGRTVAYVAGSFKLTDQQEPDVDNPPAKLRGRVEPTRVAPKR